MNIKLSLTKNDMANFDYALTLKKKAWVRALYYMLDFKICDAIIDIAT